MAKIVGGTAATPMRIPDWEQTNPLKADYIKNKPFEKVDTALDASSTNPVQNKVVAAAVGDIETALDGILAIQAELLGGDAV